MSIDGKHGTAIEWTHGDGFKGETWNPVTGCSKVSPGCANCYAETLTARFAGAPGWIDQHRPWTPENAAHNVRLHPERLDQPLHWQTPRIVFVNSMSDLFHEVVSDEFIFSVLDVMSACPRHIFQILTKRPERARDLLQRVDAAGPDWGVWEIEAADRMLVLDRDLWPRGRGLRNVWLGVSIENARFTWRADVLREIPAAVRFISAEPLLGSLFPLLDCDCRANDWVEGDNGAIRCSQCGGYTGEPGTSIDVVLVADRPPTNPRGKPLDLTWIDWLIVGGESGGRQARPMHPDWARELRDACQAEGVAFFFKQWGSHGEFGDYVGASPKSGGRLLDGREWNEMPGQQAVAA